MTHGPRGLSYARHTAVGRRQSGASVSCAKPITFLNHLRHSLEKIINDFHNTVFHPLLKNTIFNELNHGVRKITESIAARMP